MAYSEQIVKFNFFLLYGSKTSNFTFFSDDLSEIFSCFTNIKGSFLLILYSFLKTVSQSPISIIDKL